MGLSQNVFEDQLASSLSAEQFNDWSGAIDEAHRTLKSLRLAFPRGHKSSAHPAWLCRTVFNYCVAPMNTNIFI